MQKNTEGLVLRTIKYGETSIISTLFTRDFGMQAYLIRGARSSKKTGIKANYFQIGQFLDITVDYKPGKNLNYIKEVKLNSEHAIQSQNIVKQSVIQYCSELVLRCVKEEEKNEALFSFLALFFDKVGLLANENIALAPLHFTLQFAAKIGFEIYDNFSLDKPHFDGLNGSFCKEQSNNSYTSNKQSSLLIHQCLGGRDQKTFPQTIREQSLNDLIRFLKLQIDQMGDVKSVGILHQILHD
jgi:DNA repair protein RecO (recombination protein O)